MLGELEEVLPMAGWFGSRIERSLDGRDGEREVQISPPVVVYAPEEGGGRERGGDARGEAGQEVEIGEVGGEGAGDGVELFDYQWFVENIGVSGEGDVGGGEVFW